jgi:hypothetical protein
MARMRGMSTGAPQLRAGGALFLVAAVRSMANAIILHVTVHNHGAEKSARAFTASSSSQSSSTRRGARGRWATKVGDVGAGHNGRAFDRTARRCLARLPAYALTYAHRMPMMSISWMTS